MCLIYIYKVGNRQTYRNRVREAIIDITLSNTNSSRIKDRDVLDQCFFFLLISFSIPLCRLRFRTLVRDYFANSDSPSRADFRALHRYIHKQVEVVVAFSLLCLQPSFFLCLSRLGRICKSVLTGFYFLSTKNKLQIRFIFLFLLRILNTINIIYNYTICM